MSEIKIFEDNNIRAKWNDDEDKWFFVVQDVIAFLTDSNQPSKYWSALKKRTFEKERVQLSTNCRQLKFTASDGKIYKYECADNETLFRIIQSVPSPKAEPFKRWLAKLGKERLEEIEQPQKAIDRAKGYYTAKGYTKEWVETRVSGIGTRNELTKQWQDSGVEGSEYAILTNELTSATFGMDTANYKYYKGIKKKDSLRDNMNPMELVITILGEATAREISEKTNSQGLEGNRKSVLEAGKIASDTIRSIEAKTNIKIISSENHKHLNSQKNTKKILASENKLSIQKPSTGDNDLDEAISNGLNKGRPK